MKVPLEISFRALEADDGIKALVAERAAKLDEFCDHIMSCRVAIEKTQQHQATGNPFRVRIEVTVPPRHDVVVKREPSKGDMHEALDTVIRKAFDTMGLKLSQLVDRQEGRVKQHPHHEVNALVNKLYEDEGYGFLRTLDGREVYFHKNSVLHDGFDRIKIGTGVHYTEEQGEKGPQASTVRITEQISEI